jgi:hypothetical protein
LRNGKRSAPARWRKLGDSGFKPPLARALPGLQAVIAMTPARTIRRTKRSQGTTRAKTARGRPTPRRGSRTAASRKTAASRTGKRANRANRSTRRTTGTRSRTTKGGRTARAKRAPKAAAVTISDNEKRFDQGEGRLDTDEERIETF